MIRISMVDVSRSTLPMRGREEAAEVSCADVVECTNLTRSSQDSVVEAEEGAIVAVEAAGVTAGRAAGATVGRAAGATAASRAAEVTVAVTEALGEFCSRLGAYCPLLTDSQVLTKVNADCIALSCLL
jgi:hypothetical protein